MIKSLVFFFILAIVLVFSPLNGSAHGLKKLHHSIVSVNVEVNGASENEHIPRFHHPESIMEEEEEQEPANEVNEAEESDEADFDNASIPAGCPTRPPKNPNQYSRSNPPRDNRGRPCPPPGRRPNNNNNNSSNNNNNGGGDNNNNNNNNNNEN